MAVVDVVCPHSATAGETIAVTSDAGAAFDVVVPDGVGPGITFQVELPDEPTTTAAASSSDDGYGGLGAVAKELEEAHRIAAEFTGGLHSGLDMRDLKPGAAEVLSAALRQLVNAVEDAVDDLDAFIDAHSIKFASWSGTDGEQQLEWTTLHAEYVVVVEAAIAEALRELSCSEEDVFAYAALHGGDASVDKAMTRLLALAEYSKFCKMMHAHSEEEELRGSMGVMGM